MSRLARAALCAALAVALGLTAPAGASVQSGFGVGAGRLAEGARETFKQDLATGAARLVVPLVLPPGTNSLQPELALTYDSQRLALATVLPFLVIGGLLLLRVREPSRPVKIAV